MTAIGQSLIPPAFLHSYGETKYGEWLALSAGVTWLVTLDFGLQNFIVNQLSVEYFNGNLSRLRQLQSVSLRLSLGIVLITFALALGVLGVLPINSILKLDMPRRTATVMMACFVLEALLGIIWGQLNGILRSVGYPHRGAFWGQLQRGLYLGSTLTLALFKAPLWCIPIAQVATFILMTAVSLYDLRRLVPEAFPSLGYWDRATAKQILKPSLWFGTFTLNQFLVFQVPILVLNQYLGKSAVVAFSLCRTYFGLQRQSLAALRVAFRPEFTRLSGLKQFGPLSRLYSVYERTSFALTAFTSPLVFLVAPIVVKIWTHLPSLYSRPLYLTMAIASLTMTGKDARLDLQFSTNQHQKSAQICLFCYMAFAVGCVPATIAAGIIGIPALWIAVEMTQTLLIQRENQSLVASISLYDLLRFWGVGMVAIVSMLPLSGTFLEAPTALSVGIIGLVCLALGYFMYLAFDLRSGIIAAFGRRQALDSLSPKAF